MHIFICIQNFTHFWINKECVSLVFQKLERTAGRKDVCLTNAILSL